MEESCRTRFPIAGERTKRTTFREGPRAFEQMRQRAKAEAAAARARRDVGVTDPELSHELAELGFTPETVKLLPLIPVLEMAWAEGGVTAPERRRW